MLGKAYRLDVAGFSKNAALIHKGGYFNAKFAPNKTGHLRVGIVTSRKTIPKAANRNALRRRIFDFWQTGLEERSVDILIIVKPEAGKLNPRKKEDLINLQSELNSIKNKLK
ncbi:MAG: ribonuclease P protein component [Candidatus Colwellbacteria bacterium]|nr:ribonuclease P protein component [Candidatus Colwellbacteria bacterium]